MEITATKPHKNNYPDPVSFSAGDKLVLGLKDTEYDGWIWVTTSHGKQGWAPVQFIDVLSPIQGAALESYSANELETVGNEKLILLKELNGWLWVENRAGEIGWVLKELTSISN